MDVAVTIALGGVFSQKKLRGLKSAWMRLLPCKNLRFLPEFATQTPQLKIIMDDDFKPSPFSQNPLL